MEDQDYKENYIRKYSGSCDGPDIEYVPVSEVQRRLVEYIEDNMANIDFRLDVDSEKRNEFFHNFYLSL